MRSAARAACTAARSLVEAREKRDVARKLLKDGRDPVVARQFERARGVYNGARYLDQRREMLNWWAEYLAGCRKVGALVG